MGGISVKAAFTCFPLFGMTDALHIQQVFQVSADERSSLFYLRIHIDMS
jgi:hypothetical protein